MTLTDIPIKIQNPEFWFAHLSVLHVSDIGWAKVREIEQYFILTDPLPDFEEISGSIVATADSSQIARQEIEGSDGVSHNALFSDKSPNETPQFKIDVDSGAPSLVWAFC